MDKDKNIGTGMIVLLPSVMMCFSSRETPTFCFYIDWFTLNYKDKTESKLPESGLCTHVILKTCVL